MTRIEWFDLLAELAPEPRNKALLELQRTDPLLAEELKDLLALDASAVDFDVGGQLTDAIAAAVQARNNIPQFTLLGLLGQGGMGEVWHAERTVAGNTQSVALKILKFESDSAELQERFALEQRTLLKLEHPNIARLLDAGTAGDGRPWIAMELVQGAPITTYCDQHRLSIAARLKLFRQVIAAVQYAHDHLIVHRDIKPDNVLVDQTGTIKLLDFGIAKTLDRHEPNTLTQQRFFSLYATAPEQLLGSSVCVGTDVYALGGLLYELLSGAPLIGSAIKTPAQLQNFIVQQTPTLPSRNLDIAAAVNRNSATVAKLSATLRGDLDRIVLHALRKLPSERYASAREFDEDIAAYLELRPVKAAGQGAGYRASKFLRRHWVLVGTSTLALLGLLTLTVLLAVRGNELKTSNTLALQQQRRAEAEKLNADEARVAAESVNAFLIDVFKRADPLARARGDKGLSVVIDASFAEIKAKQKFDRASAPLLIALVQGLASLGKTDRAGPLLAQIESEVALTTAQQIQCALIGGEIAHTELEHAELERRIAQLQAFDASLLNATQQNRLLDLRAQLADELDELDSVLRLTEKRELNLGVFSLRISALVRSKREVEARNLLSERLQRVDNNPIDRPFLLSMSGRIANRTEDRKSALVWHRQAFEAALKLYGADSPRLLSYRNEYADVMRRNGLFVEALVEFHEIRRLALMQFKPDDPRLSAIALNTAICEAKLGKLSSSGRQRLEQAASQGVNEISLTAFVALLRDDYFNGRIRAFESRALNLRAQLGSTKFTPELALWFAVFDHQDRLSPVWTQLITDATEFDPFLRSKFSK